MVTSWKLCQRFYNFSSKLAFSIESQLETLKMNKEKIEEHNVNIPLSYLNENLNFHFSIFFSQTLRPP